MEYSNNQYRISFKEIYSKRRKLRRNLVKWQCRLVLNLVSEADQEKMSPVKA